jgi:hypothetical protein
MTSWQKPGPSGTAGVHKDIPVDAYNLSPDGTLVATPWAHMDTFRPPAKVLHKSAFAAELECTEKNTRHWIHRFPRARSPAPALHTRAATLSRPCVRRSLSTAHPLDAAGGASSIIMVSQLWFQTFSKGPACRSPCRTAFQWRR